MATQNHSDSRPVTSQHSASLSGLSGAPAQGEFVTDMQWVSQDSWVRSILDDMARNAGFSSEQRKQDVREERRRKLTAAFRDVYLCELSKSEEEWTKWHDEEAICLLGELIGPCDDHEVPDQLVPVILKRVRTAYELGYELRKMEVEDIETESRAAGQSADGEAGQAAPSPPAAFSAAEIAAIAASDHDCPGAHR